MSTRKSSSKKQASGQQKKTSVVKQARVNRRLRAAAKRLAREKSRQGHQHDTQWLRASPADKGEESLQAGGG